MDYTCCDGCMPYLMKGTKVLTLSGVLLHTHMCVHAEYKCMHALIHEIEPNMKGI